MEKRSLDLYFSLFNEIGIIAQLSRARFEARLPDGFLLPHFTVLNHLIRVEDGRTPLELARAFQVPKATMTHTLGGLERAQLVELRPNPDDGRSKRVWLTKAGRRFRDDAIASLNTDISKLPPDLSEKDLATLVTQLAQLRATLDANRG